MPTTCRHCARHWRFKSKQPNLVPVGLMGFGVQWSKTVLFKESNKYTITSCEKCCEGNVLDSRRACNHRNIEDIIS